LQNLISGTFSKPQRTHLSLSAAPHSPQNFVPLAFTKLHAGQRIGGPMKPPIPIDPVATRIQATGANTSSSRIAAKLLGLHLQDPPRPGRLRKGRVPCDSAGLRRGRRSRSWRGPSGGGGESAACVPDVGRIFRRGGTVTGFIPLGRFFHTPPIIIPL